MQHIVEQEECRTVDRYLTYTATIHINLQDDISGKYDRRRHQSNHRQLMHKTKSTLHSASVSVDNFVEEHMGIYNEHAL